MNRSSTFIRKNFGQFRIVCCWFGQSLQSGLENFVWNDFTAFEVDGLEYKEEDLKSDTVSSVW